MQKTEDQILSECLRSLGPWKDSVVIGGGYALIIYKVFLADPMLSNHPVGTRDIDTLIPRKIPTISKKNISKYLKEAEFSPIFKDYDHPATEAYVKEIGSQEIEIEFLTDNATRKEKNKNVLIAGVVAQPLSYLTLSLKNTLSFQTYSGETGNVVSPGAWIFHKGLTFTKRKTKAKECKDLYGIWYVATQLGLFSKRALEEFHELAQDSSSWFKKFQKNLLSWIENATPMDWSLLETQDPGGRLKQLQFERIARKITQT